MLISTQILILEKDFLLKKLSIQPLARTNLFIKHVYEVCVGGVDMKPFCLPLRMFALQKIP